MIKPPKFLHYVIAAAITLAVAWSQSVVTDPVGFNKVTCLGNSDTMITIPLQRAAEFIGSIQSVSGNVLTVANSPGWTSNQFVYVNGIQPKTYYVLIGSRPVALAGTLSLTSGSKTITGTGTNFTTSVVVGDGLIINSNYYVVMTVTSNTSLVVNLAPPTTASGLSGSVSKSAKEGSFYTVTANGSSSLTLDLNGDDLSSVAANTNITLIPYWTLGTAFPGSDAGASFVPSSTTFSRKTEILIPNIAGTGINLSSSKTYFYFNNAWRLFGDDVAVNHGDDVLLPDAYFTLRNNDATTTTFTASGSVSVGKMATPLATLAAGKQDNFISVLRPTNVSLDDSGLIVSGAFVASTSTFNRADELLVFDNASAGQNKSASTTYFYYNGGWRKFGQDVTTDFGSDVIPAGAGIILRKASTADGVSVVWQNSPNYLLN